MLIASLLAACSSVPDATDLAGRHNIPLSHVQAGDFRLPVLGRLPTGGGELRVYLPGDGIPWRGHRPSDNPTGRRHIALELLLRDPSPAVLLGRPCYLQGTLDSGCEPALWTRARYSETVVATLDSALRLLIEQSHASSILLIGYSGGGTLAALLGARQSLPTTVVTIAANLDTEAWTRHHRHLPLDASLNPARDLPANAALRQMHFLGEDDRVVPVHTLAVYQQRHPAATWLPQSGFDHRCCWVEAWPALLEQALAGEARRPMGPKTPSAVPAPP